MSKASAGVMILANVFLRPVLMIFGFILAARLLFAAVFYVTESMQAVLFSETGNGLLHIFAFPVKLTIYTTFVITITNKAFALIHIIPDQITRWMSGSPESDFGSDSILSEAKGKFDSASQQGGGALAASGQAGNKSVGDAAKKAKDD